MATYGELKNRVLRLLDDAGGTQYDDSLLADAIEAAQIAILPWMPKTGSTSLASGSIVYALPDDCYAIESIVVNSTGEMLPQAIFAPGRYRGLNVQPTNDWIVYPSGSVTFSKAIPSGETYDLFYLAYWLSVNANTQDATLLEPPSQAMVGMAFYAAGYALQPMATSSSTIRQFNQRMDSGNPEHNPVQRTSTYLFQLFQNEMNRHPRYQKAQT